MHIACHELERVDLRRFVNDEPSHRRHRECAAIEQRWVGQHIQRAKHDSASEKKTPNRDTRFTVIRQVVKICLFSQQIWNMWFSVAKATAVMEPVSLSPTEVPRIGGDRL